MNVIFLGPPGAGKGTVARPVTEQHGITAISTGDLLREAVKAGSGLGLKAKGYMDAGELVPDTLVIDLLKARIDQPDCAAGCLLDGFPRTIPQAEALESADVPIHRVINLKVDDQLVIRRLSGRRIQRDTGRVYNVNPDGSPQPPVDMAPDELIQRDDDKPEAIGNRLEVYRRQTEPLIAFYRERDLLVDINAAQPIDAIVADVMKAL